MELLSPVDLGDQSSLPTGGTTAFPTLAVEVWTILWSSFCLLMQKTRVEASGVEFTHCCNWFWPKDREVWSLGHCEGLWPKSNRVPVILKDILVFSPAATNVTQKPIPAVSVVAWTRSVEREIALDPIPEVQHWKNSSANKTNKCKEPSNQVVTQHKTDPSSSSQRRPSQTFTLEKKHNKDVMRWASTGGEFQIAGSDLGGSLESSSNSVIKRGKP